MSAIAIIGAHIGPSISATARLRWRGVARPTLQAPNVRLMLRAFEFIASLHLATVNYELMARIDD